MDLSQIGISLAFLAGMASFFSPCVFALVPAYIGYLGGRSVASARDGRQIRWVTLSHGLAFVLGFSVVFITLGVATSALGGLLFDLKYWLARIGGIVVVIFGLHMTGLIRLKFLEYDLRPQSIPDRRRGYIASFLMGIFFSAGWSPCVGPILGAILTFALNGGNVYQGLALLTAYSAGLAIPFLIASTQIGLVTAAIQRYGRIMRYIEIATGVLLIVVGLLLFSGKFQQIASFGTFLGSFDELEMGKFLLLAILTLALLGIIPAVIASKKGRNFIDWWFFGAGLFPVALPMAIRLKPNESDGEVASSLE